MKIVIVGGSNEADFLISSLLNKNHKLLVINNDEKYCNYLAVTHNIAIVNGDPCKHYVLDDAHIYNYDILIALEAQDADNLAICQAAKRIYGIKKAVCTVSNPKNVQVFKKLGVNTVISSAYMVANMIEQATSLENLIKTLSFEDEKIILSEILVDRSFPVVQKQIMNIDLPQGIIISCIFRGNDMIVPNGQTVLLIGDKLIILSSPMNQEAAIKAISGRN